LRDLRLNETIILKRILKKQVLRVFTALLDLMGTQEVRWDKGGTVQAEDYTLIYGKRNENQLGTGFCVERKISAVKRVEFVSDRMSNTVLRG
jgi:hypothetical protein